MKSISVKKSPEMANVGGLFPPPYPHLFCQLLPHWNNTFFKIPRDLFGSLAKKSRDAKASDPKNISDTAPSTDPQGVTTMRCYRI